MRTALNYIIMEMSPLGFLCATERTKPKYQNIVMMITVLNHVTIKS